MDVKLSSQQTCQNSVIKILSGSAGIWGGMWLGYGEGCDPLPDESSGGPHLLSIPEQQEALQDRRDVARTDAQVSNVSPPLPASPPPLRTVCSCVWGSLVLLVNDL